MLSDKRGAWSLTVRSSEQRKRTAHLETKARARWGWRVSAVADLWVSDCRAGGRRAFPLPPCHGTACTCDLVPLRGCCTYPTCDRASMLGTYPSLLWLLLRSGQRT